MTHLGEMTPWACLLIGAVVLVYLLICVATGKAALPAAMLKFIEPFLMFSAGAALMYAGLGTAADEVERWMLNQPVTLQVVTSGMLVILSIEPLLEGANRLRGIEARPGVPTLLPCFSGWLTRASRPDRLRRCRSHPGKVCAA